MPSPDHLIQRTEDPDSLMPHAVGLIVLNRVRDCRLFYLVSLPTTRPAAEVEEKLISFFF